MSGFKALVRFEIEGVPSYGNLVASTDAGFQVTKFTGTLAEGFTPDGTKLYTVANLLCPVESTPIIQCVGVNYRKHAAEAKLTVPAYPVIFSKPADALAGPTESIPIHISGQKMMDYEGELVVVIGQDCKNVSEEDALSYVLGYCVGNDASARTFQLPENSGGQFGYAKSFDKFAPIGPAIWSTEVVKDPQTLKFVLRVNGEVRQETGTDDMIWSVRQIIAHLSRGTTLRKGTVIMTGTPAGVGYFAKKFLKDGDLVEVELEGLGKIANKMVFE